MPRTRGSALAAVVIVLGGGGAAVAGAATEQVQQYADHVQQILNDPSLKQADKREAVRKVAEQVFDVNETAKRALGIHWQKRTPAEREEFVQLFADLLESTYIAKIDIYVVAKVQTTGELVDAD